MRRRVSPPSRRAPGHVRRRLDDASPTTRAALLCAGAVVAIGAASADWTVDYGDTLYSIARAHDTTVDALIAANPDIDDPNLIYVGDEVAIPDGRSPTRDTPATTSEATADPAPEADSTPQRDASASDGEVRETTVRADDSLISISRRLGVTQEQFLVANGYTHELRLLVGARVRSHAAPPPGSGTPGTSDGSHEVALGDTVQDIAVANGVSWQDVVDANDLDDPSRIYVGQRLAIPGRAASGGGFVCPVAGGASFVNDFGLAKGGDRYHEGLDMFAARGTDVLAPVSGRVEHVRGTRGGKQVHLFGDDGYRYWGVHLDTLGPTGRVSAGDVIGTVGTTGNAALTSPHLHFEAWYQGESVNPHPALAEAC